MIRDVTDLLVYKNALELIPSAYDLISQIPFTHIKLRNQITECAESIPAHIAEGYGKKRSEKEFKRFLEIAMGTSDEIIAHLNVVKILSMRIKRIGPALCDLLIEKYKIESKQINKLIKNWNNY